MSSVVLPPARYVIIAADNDQAGREAAAALANRLEAEGRSVLIVKPPYRDEDWNDVLVEDGTEAPVIWKQQLKKARKTKRVRPDRWYYVEDFMHLTFPRREMLLAPWLPSPGIAMVYAKQGHAKTFFALAVAFAVARGQASCAGNARSQPVSSISMARCPGPISKRGWHCLASHQAIR